MILLNFSHPLTLEQQSQVEQLTGQPLGRVIQVPVQFDSDQPFLPQLHKMLAAVPLTPEQWQAEPILVVPPSLNFITALLLADLHGRMGYFPSILRLRPVAGTTPTRFEVAEILNLQALREEARKER
jgi:hypothetical protein